MKFYIFKYTQKETEIQINRKFDEFYKNNNIKYGHFMYPGVSDFCWACDEKLNKNYITQIYVLNHLSDVLIWEADVCNDNCANFYILKEI